MSIKTHSAFYFGYVVNADNQYINFKEGAGVEKTAIVPVGTYSLTRLLQVVAAALNTASLVDWSLQVNRSTRVVTLTASLLFGTGGNAVKSIAPLLGFNLLDYNNLTIFTGAFASGKAYYPQYLLQDYKDKTETQKLINATINKSASKQTVSVQHFGVEMFYKFNIKYITNRNVEGSPAFWVNNSSAVEEAKEFLQWITQKYIVEFMPDQADPDTYDRMYLDTSAQDNDGVGYTLIEYVDRDLPNFFESGLLTFTVITKEY
jgi:hypothetical protein